MNPYTYKIFSHPLRIGAQFRQGQTDGNVWLVGAETRTQIDDLMRRLEKLLANAQALTLEQIEQVQEEFESWYQAEFQKARHKEYSESEEGHIVRSLGVAWADTAGRVTLYRSQTFRFCQIRTDEQLVPFNDEYGTLQLTPGAQLVASPNDPMTLGDLMAQQVRDVLKASNAQWESLNTTAFNRSVAVLRAEQAELPISELHPIVDEPLIQSEREPINWKPYALPTVGVLALTIMLLLSYTFRDNLSELLNRKSDPKREVVTDPRITKPASPTVTNQRDSRPTPGTSAQQLSMARQTFALAEFFRKQGQPDPARKRYQLARKQFEESCQRQPTFCREADSSLAVIEANLQLLNSKSEF